MANYSHSGEWIKLSLGTFNATVEKTSANEVQISINVIGKTGRWTTSAALSTTSRFSVYTFSGSFCRSLIGIQEVEGVIYFKVLSDISDGLYANYNDDRIVFYKSDYTAKNFTSYVRHFYSLYYLSLG